MADDEDSFGKLEKMTRKEFLKYAALGAVGLAMAITGIYEVPRVIRTRKALSVIDTLNPNYSCRCIADGLINPKELAVNPRDSKVYFVQKYGDDWGEYTGAAEGVYELSNGNIKEIFGGADDPWGGIHETQIAINSQNEICIYTRTYVASDIFVFNLVTGKQEEGLDLPYNHTEEQDINTVKRIRDRGFDLGDYYQVRGVTSVTPANKIPYSSTTIGGDGTPVIARVKEGFLIRALDLDREGNIYFIVSADSNAWNRKGKIIQISKR